MPPTSPHYPAHLLEAPMLREIAEKLQIGELL
jgi:hypothetical protein